MTIGANVFRGKNISKVTLGANVTSIGEYAFYDCNFLTEVAFVSATAANGLTVGDYAFGRCDQLSSISLPAGTTSIGASAFSGCGKITQFTIPEGVTDIGESAFSSSGLTSVFIPASVTYMGESKTGTGGDYYYFDIFANCYSLTTVTVDEKSNSYASRDGILYKKSIIDVNGNADDPANYFISALAFCPRLNGGVNGAVDIPSTVRAVWQNAFYANEKITEITFSKGLEAVSYGDGVIPATLTFASGTFQSCEKLEKVSLPEGLTDIDSGTFAWCNTLKEVYIPASIAYIAPRAFDSCGQLSVVNFAETPEGEEGVPLVIGSSSSTNYTGVFSDCGSITSLKLPEHTAELGNYVFEGCTGLTTLHLPASLTKIGTYAFSGVPLETLIFAEGSQLKEIGNSAFYGCRLTEIALPEGLETIGNYAFQYSKLQSVTIPASVRTINQYAFGYCYDLESVTFAKDSAIEMINQNAFINDRSLKSVTFDGCVAEELELGSSAFMGCTALESFVVPENVTKIGLSCFLFCISMTDFQFESVAKGTVSKLEKIDNNAFKGTGISEFVFPESSADSISLGTKMFFACPNLTSVTLSPQITNISDVFTGCLRLESITIPAENKNFISSGGVIYNQNQDVVDILFVYSVTTPDEEGKTLVDENGRVVLPSNTTQIGASAFAGRDDIKSVVIPASVQTIGNYAFSGCVNLEEVIFEGDSQLDTIGTYAFQNCKSLKSITIPSGVTKINNQAFRNTGLTSVSVPGEGTGFGTYVFADCANLSEVNLNDGIKTLGTYMFQNCTSLKTITIPSGVTQLPNYIFDQCTSLTSVTLPSGVTKFGNYAFRNTGLTSVAIPDTITSFGTYVFADCANLSEVTFAENMTVKSLGNYMFMNCTALKTITLPASLTYLGTRTFQGSGLTRIDLTALTGLTCLGTSATSCTATSSVYLFDACADLEEVILPASVKKIGAYVFRDCASLENVVMDGVELIGKQAFMNTGLKNLALPGTMKQFGDDAFRNCANLQTIAINSNVTSYGKYVFAECPLLAEVTIGGGATKLGDYMFYGCAALKTATLPGTVTYLGRYTFQGSGLTEIDLSALTQLTCFGTSATSCSTSAVSYVFADCKDLTRVVLPDSLTKIGGYAFYGCESLTDINLGNVVQFNDFALAGTSIGSVTLSSALTHVGAGVFAGCANVEEIAVRAGSSGYRSVSGVLYNADNEIVAYPSGKVPEGGVLTITADMGVGEGAFAGCTGISEVVIEEGITVIGDYAFYDSAVKKVTLPSTLTEIGQYAFAYSDVAEIALPSTLTEIGKYAFAYSALKSVTVPESVSTMGEYAFAYSMLESATLQGSYFVTHMFDGCGQLSQVTIAEGATSIAAYMFQDCYSLTEISIPESVTNISTYSFAGSGLKNFVVEERFEWVGDYAFANSALESVTIKQDMYTSGMYGKQESKYVFSGCANLSEVTVAEGVTVIVASAFENCTALKSVYALGADGVVRGEEGKTTFPESLTGIGMNAFKGTGFTIFTLPANVNSLESGAFANCTALKSVVLPETIDDISGTLFEGCTALESVTLPAGVTQIYNGAFNGCTAIREFVIPASIANVVSPFAGWTAEQTIYIAVSEAETLQWWNANWRDDCNAKIVFESTGPSAAEV